MSEIVFLMLHSLAKGLVLVLLASGGLSLCGSRLSLRQQRWVYTAFVLALLIPLSLFKRELPLPTPVALPPAVARSIPVDAVTPVPVAAAPVELPETTLPAVRQSRDWAALAGGVYLAVALLIFARRLALVLRWELKTRRCPAIGDERLLRLAAEARELARYRGRARLLDGSGVLASPGCFGLLRPKLLFPCEELRHCSDAEILMFLLHEYTHLAAGDQRGTICFYLLDAVLWFNPFYFALRRRLLRLWESICDETVIERCGNDAALKKSYARLVASLSIGESAVPGAALSGTAREIKNRMEGIMKSGSRKQNLVLTVALLLSGLGAALVLPGCETKTAKIEMPVFTPPADMARDDINWLKLSPKINQLVKDRKYEEALAIYVWYFNNVSKILPSNAGVKVSFTLMAWKELGEKYPRALDVLRQIREERAEFLRSGKAQLTYSGRDWKANPPVNEEEKDLRYIDGFGDTWQFSDVMGIDRLFGEKKKTYLLFLEIERVQPEMAKKVWYYAEEPVVAAGDLQLALKYTPDFRIRWDQAMWRIKDYQKIEPKDMNFVLRYGFLDAEQALKIFRLGTTPEEIAFTKQCEIELVAKRKAVAEAAKAEVTNEKKP